MKFLILIIFSILSVNFASASSEQPEIRIVANIDKSGYVGQALVYEVTLMSNSPNVSNVKLVQAPEFPKSVTVIKGVVKNKRPVEKKEKGKTYYCWTIERDYIIPEEKGKFRIGEGKYVAFLPFERIVDDFFWGKRRVIDYEEIRVESKETSFKVSDLPAAGATNEFSGCIGDFNIEGWFPPGKITAGREAYAVFSISGYGDLESIKMPNLNKIFATGCHLKEVEQNEERIQRDGKLFSEVTLTCRFVPEEEEFRIDPLCIEFFNPDTKKYYKSCSDALHWTGQPQETQSTRISKEAIEI